MSKTGWITLSEIHLQPQPSSCLCAFVVGSEMNAMADMTTKTQSHEFPPRCPIGSGGTRSGSKP